jgi:Trk-type K+ transport system membrane component
VLQVVELVILQVVLVRELQIRVLLVGLVVATLTLLMALAAVEVLDKLAKLVLEQRAAMVEMVSLLL